MENVNGIDAVWAVLHCGLSGGVSHPSHRAGAGRQRAPEPASLVRGWTPYHTVTESQVGEPVWTGMTDHAGVFVLLSVAMRGAFPDAVAGHRTPVASTTAGVPMLVDYVAVWRGARAQWSFQGTMSRIDRQDDV
jgi:hypothetical protein